MSNTSRKLSSDEVSALMEGLQSGEIDSNSGINNDVEVAKDFLEPLVKCLDVDKHIGMVSPKIHYYNHPKIIQYAGC